MLSVNNLIGFGSISDLSSISIDQYFNYVTMLLQGNGTNGAQNNTFLDGSPNNFTITRNGNTTQGSFGPYGDRWSNYFDGNSDSLDVAASGNLQLNGDFTVEAWAWIDSTVVASRPDNLKVVTLYGAYGATSGTFQIGVSGDASNAGTGLYIYQDNPSINASVTVSVPLNSWVHLAFVRTGSTLYGFINGIRYTLPVNGGSATATLISSSNISRVGGGINTSYIGWFKGYISNFRLLNGTALYTANFTPPTAPLTAITNTSLLTCQSNRFVDNSSNNFTITRNGDVSVRPFSPFAPSAAYSTSVNGGSGYFDGSGDNLQFNPGSAFAFGTGAFTIEAWVYFTSAPNNQYIIDARNAGQTTNWAWGWGLGAGYGLCFFDGSAVYGESTPTAARLSAWNHCVAVRSGNALSLYVNGQRISTSTVSFNLNVSPTSSVVGARYTATDLMTGYMTDVRTVKGTAVYDPSLTTLTVPTAPLTAVTNTGLLLNFTNAGVVDSTADNVLETVGNAQISTSVKKYGTGSLAFDGTGDWLLAPTNVDQSFGTGDFTVEAWVWVDSTVNPGRPDNLKTVTVFSTGSTSANDCSFAIYGNTTTPGIGLELYQASPSLALSVAATVATNSWVHVAWVRSGTTVYGFVGGTRYTLGTTSSAIGSPTSPKIGSASTTNYSNQFKGYIDDLRVTKGVARYTANFTPPDTEFPRQ